MSAPPDIEIDLASSLPVYRQVADALRTQLVGGRLKEGDPLPTVRRLAMDLTVNHNTIAQAYRLLAEEGWIELVQGRGATVRARRPGSPSPSVEVERHRFARRLRELAAEALSSGVPERWLRDELRRVASPTGFPVNLKRRRT